MLHIEWVSTSSVRVGGHEITVEEIDDFIAALARARAALQPPVTFRWDGAGAVDVTADPAFKIGPTKDGTLLLALRHIGLGWCCFELSLPAAGTLRQYLAKHTVGVAGQTLGDDIGDRDAAH